MIGRLFSVVALAAGIAMAAPAIPSGATGTPLTCGMTITTSVTLTQDLVVYGHGPVRVGDLSGLAHDRPWGHTVSSKFDNPTPDPEAPNSSTLQLSGNGGHFRTAAWRSNGSAGAT